MTASSEPAPGLVLPYPHCRNDCDMCREMDADFGIVEEPVRADGRPRRYCQGCLGRWMVTTATYGRDHQASPGDPLTVTVAMLRPGGGAW